MFDPIRVGYARVDITPDRPMRMLGYAQPPGGRYHKVVLDPIYLTCLAFSDEMTTVLLCSVDLVGMTEEAADASGRSIHRSMMTAL